MKLELPTEAALEAAAGQAARNWRDGGLQRLTAGLSGNLGVGKTTFVRALLRGLGYTGRVPSPTYTLLEHYDIGPLTVVHLDLYRLAEARELEYLGIRDWLARDKVWLLAEWPEKGGSFAASVDLAITLATGADDVRILHTQTLTGTGRAAEALWLEPDVNKQF